MNTTGFPQFICSSCNKSCRSLRGLNQHRARSATCKSSPSPPEEREESPPIASDEYKTQSDVLLPPLTDVSENILYVWGRYRDKEFEENVSFIYEQIVFWKKNLFLLPTGKAGREYIGEIVKLLSAWINDSPMRVISMKAIMIMPSLLLQKPSKTSKAKEHLEVLERRMELWKSGDVLELLNECITIQRNLKSSNPKKTIAQISKKFAEEMQKGNINGALKLLTNNMQNGVLPLNDETIKKLRMKHPVAAKADPEVMLPDDAPVIHPIRYECINADAIRKSAIRTKGGSGPSGLDAEGWRRILTSKSFGTSSIDLCKALALFTKKLCSQKIDSSTLEALLACRLIPLDKNPGIRPIGVSEILRRIVGKVVIAATKNDIVESVGSLQVCAGHEAGCEAIIHAMHSIYSEEDAEAVLLVDASNAFNSVNREVFLHNIKVICPSIATFVRNCYSKPSRLFVIGGIEITSNEGTTQGDPVAMAVYAIAIIPLVLMILEITDNTERTKTAAYADDLTAAGTIKGIRYWWNELCRLGPKFGYFPEPTKSWLIVKPSFQQKADDIFKGTGVNITTEGKRHLGASIGSHDFRDAYLSSKVDQWINELKTLSEIAKSQPQAAYCCFITGFRHKVTYFMRTINGAACQLKRLDQVTQTHFIPAITNGVICNVNERKLLSLPPKLGGLGIPMFSETSNQEYENSLKITNNLCSKIINQSRQYTADVHTKTIKNDIQTARNKYYKEALNNLRLEMNDQQLRINDLNLELGASTWLTTLPLKEEGYRIDKQLFWDLIRLRYGWQLTRVPETCECGAPFTIQHALSCKKGGFISLRHNKVRNITANLLKEVCKDVHIEPQLQPLTGESFSERTANITDEARCDVSARGFWSTGQTAFLDIRVFNPNASRYVNQNLKKAYEINEKEKKRAYNERIMEIEHGSFTPIVMSAFGGMGRECKKFYSRLSDMIAEKRNQPYEIVVSWIRRKISFALIQSLGICIRGSRSLSYSNLVESVGNEPYTSEAVSNIEDVI